MAEFYDVYQKDKWKEPGYRLMDKFSLKGKKGFVTGGAGGIGDFVTLFRTLPGVDAGLAASIFHFGQVTIPELKRELKKNNIHVRV